MPNDTDDAQEQEQEPVEQQPTGDEAYHVVRPGESWAGIAAAYSTSVEALHALNADTPHFSDRSVSVNATVRVR